jgi:hypothetical protein
MAPREPPLDSMARGRSHPAYLQSLGIGLARRPDMVLFARRLVGRVPAGDRVARVGAVFHFVAQLVEAAPAPGARRGLLALLDHVGPDRGPAVILAGLLLALGERARIECLREMAFVDLEVAEPDVLRLPPFAQVRTAGGRRLLPLDARGGRPLGFLAGPLREALQKRLSA